MSVGMAVFHFILNYVLLSHHAVLEWYYPGEPIHLSSLSGIIKLTVRIIWTLVIKLNLVSLVGPRNFNTKSMTYTNYLLEISCFMQMILISYKHPHITTSLAPAYFLYYIPWFGECNLGTFVGVITNSFLYFLLSYDQLQCPVEHSKMDPKFAPISPYHLSYSDLTATSPVYNNFSHILHILTLIFSLIFPN